MPCGRPSRILVRTRALAPSSPPRGRPVSPTRPDSPRGVCHSSSRPRFATLLLAAVAADTRAPAESRTVIPLDRLSGRSNRYRSRSRSRSRRTVHRTVHRRPRTRFRHARIERESEAPRRARERERGRGRSGTIRLTVGNRWNTSRRDARTDAVTRSIDYLLPPPPSAPGARGACVRAYLGHLLFRHG